MAETVKVRLIQTVHARFYDRKVHPVGEVLNLPPDLAREWVERSRVAEYIARPAQEKPKKKTKKQATKKGSGAPKRKAEGSLLNDERKADNPETRRNP